MSTGTVIDAGAHGGVRLRSLLAPTLVGVPILLLVLASLGGLTEAAVPGLPVVPLATLVSLPLDVWIRDIATAITVGGALVGGVLAPRPDARLGRLTSGAALVWLAALAVQAFLTVSQVLALPWRSALDPTIIWSLLTQTTLGRTMLIQFVLVALIALLGWVVLDRVTGLIIAIAAAGAAFLPGFTGHSGITDGHVVATLSLGLHVVAASAWVGGLIATIVYVAHRSADGGLVLKRFSLLALVCVIVLAESGLLNASLRLDGPAALITSAYGSIILAKVCVLTVLIGFGIRQRRTVIGALDPASPTPTLVRLGAWEVAWMGAVMGLAVALARTAPPAQVVSGDAMSMASIVILGLSIPLAVRFATNSTSRGPLGEYPEAAAVITVVAMTALPTALRSGLLGPQWSALVALVALPVAGWVFWSAVDAPDRWMARGIVIVALPAITWWAERGIPGGLTWSTWLVTSLGVGSVVWFGASRVTRHAPATSAGVRT